MIIELQYAKFSLKKGEVARIEVSAGWMYRLQRRNVRSDYRYWMSFTKGFFSKSEIFAEIVESFISINLYMAV